jgi:hypothetical protein
MVMIVLALLGGCGADGRPIPPGSGETTETGADGAGAQPPAVTAPASNR